MVLVASPPEIADASRMTNSRSLLAELRAAEAKDQAQSFQKLLDDNGQEKDLPGMENLGLSPLPDGMVRLFSEYENQDLAYVGGTQTKYVPIGDRVEVSVGLEPGITMQRRLNDQCVRNVVARQYKRRLDNTYVWHYDLIDFDDTDFFMPELEELTAYVAPEVEPVAVLGVVDHAVAVRIRR